MAGVGLKICGMKYPKNIIEVGSYPIIWVIFWEKSADISTV
jgi:phosphoribosylanthranilate isomerase